MDANIKPLKPLLSSLCPPDLHTLLKHFASLTSDQLQMSCKEISYKCYESTTMMRNRRACGFGRTESEATANGLRNLVELMLEEEGAAEVIREGLRRMDRKIVLEGNEAVEEKENCAGGGVVKIQLDMTRYQRKSLGARQPLGNNTSVLNMSINEEGNRSKGRLALDNLTTSALKLSHQNILLEKSQTNIQKGSINFEQELKKAKSHIANLQSKLKQVLDENAMLKIQLQKSQPKDPPRKQPVLTTAATTNYLDKLRSISVQNPTSSNHPNTSTTTTTDLNNSFIQKKNKAVPRLKLQVLPNYHGKSNKSINQTLLAAYQDKHKKPL